MIDGVMIELLRTTGAARRFLADRVEPAVVHQILDDARFAPSGGNRQPWKVAVVEDLALRREIASLMQGVWDDYKARPAGITPYNVVDDVVPDSTPHVDYELLDAIAEIPVVLAVAADLRRIALMDRDLARVPVTGGASIYPFCWSILLSARSRGLGGVMTTFLSHVRARRRAPARPPRAPRPRRDDLPRRPRARHDEVEPRAGRALHHRRPLRRRGVHPDRHAAEDERALVGARSPLVLAAGVAAVAGRVGGGQLVGRRMMRRWRASAGSRSTIAAMIRLVSASSERCFSSTGGPTGP